MVPIFISKQNGFIGLVNDESGCNVMSINQNIHCTGTHTECAGHILADSISINDVLDTSLNPIKRVLNSKLSFISM